jgi:putative transcriptional regulator
VSDHAHLGLSAKRRPAALRRELGRAPPDPIVGAWPGYRQAEVRVKNSVRDLRGQLNWTQADLAEKLGVSRQTVNAIETEKYDPSLPLAFKIARIFRKPVEDIFKA